MILRFFSFVSLLLLVLMGLNVAIGYSPEVLGTYLTLSLIFVVLCVGVYVLSASSPNFPWRKKKS